MFSADCDQCGARNKLPASAQDQGISSGSLIPCPNCGAEVCVRLAIPATEGEAVSVASEELGEPIGEAIVPKDEAGDDEATQVLEPNLLPDAVTQRPATVAAADELEPTTPRRTDGSAAVDASELDLEPATARRGPTVEGEAAAISEVPLDSVLDSSPDSLVPLSDRDFLPTSEKPARHLPVPPVRERHAAATGAGDASEDAPLSFGTPTLAALVRKANPPPPRRESHDDEANDQDVLMPPAGPIDELWDARVVPLLRQPTMTDAPVASVSRPPEAPKEQPRSNGALGFALLVAGVAFVAGLAVKNAKETESSQAAIPAAAPIPEAPAVNPMPQPAIAEAPATPPPAPPAEQPSESAAGASPPPTLAAPDGDIKRTSGAASNVGKVTATDAPKSAAMNANIERPIETPRSTVAPVRSATVSTDAPPAEVAFNADATASALNAAAQRASSCKKPTDPSGVAVVTITFAPTGRVTSANISGPPFAGTETGSCIASVLRGVKVPAYTGDFMTVKKTIQVE